MRLKSLKQLDRTKLIEVELGRLPERILIDRYALDKAFKISRLVTELREESIEWYGFTIGERKRPEEVVDIGLPENERNAQQYTSINPEMILDFQDSLPGHLLINGWIHSHADLEFKRFSGTDELNNRTVLEYVSPSLKKPVAKKEIRIEDWSFLEENKYGKRDLAKGSVSLITDTKISSARLLETVFGSFCFCIVIGDNGWHEQKICYKKRGILTGDTGYECLEEAELVLFDSGRKLVDSEMESLASKVRESIRPVTSPPPERLERM